ncbi:MAG TPA: chloride channel protein [Devosia sp.]|nr:chloride channel protein [Devosia sp.]
MEAGQGKPFQVVYNWVKPNIDSFLGLQKPKLWAMALLAGIAGALVSIAFRQAIGLVQWLWTGTTSEIYLDKLATLPWWTVLLAPTLGGFVVGLILLAWGPTERAGAVADVIEERAQGSERLNFKRASISTLVSLVTLGSGGSAGREGPVVYYAAAVAKSLFSFFELPPSARRIMLAAGVAAAISASFNAPIAGVLFAHEVILGHFAMAAFVPLVIAAALAFVLAGIWFGNAPIFILPDFHIASMFEMPAFALLGLTCAIVAVLFQASLVGSDWINRRLNFPTLIRPMLGGFLVGMIALLYPEVLGVGYEATESAISNRLGIGLLLGLIIAKTAATAITLGSGMGGGVFSPSLYLGAMTGAAFGIIASGFFPEFASTPSLYAIIGMGAVAAAVLGAPVSTTVMIFELTGSFSFSIAVLLAVSISTGISQTFMGRSFFFWQLYSRGIMLEEGPHTHLAKQVFVGNLMKPFDPDINPPPLDPSRIWLRENDNLADALKAFSNSGKTRILVTCTKDNTPCGWIYHVDALSNFNEALVEKSREEHC